MDKETKQAIIKKFQRDEKDCGSSEVQIALLTARINELAQHMKVHKKDFSSNRGLIAMVNTRRRLLAYLMREDFARYSALIKELNLRR